MHTKISAVLERLLRDRIQLKIELKEAAHNELEEFEAATGLQMPDDFRTFYSLFSELDAAKEEFRMMPLPEIIENEYFHKEGFFFGCMPAYYELWRVVIDENDPNNYMILTKEGEITSPLADFLDNLMEHGSSGIFPAWIVALFFFVLLILQRNIIPRYIQLVKHIIKPIPLICTDEGPGTITWFIER